ncbi:hypothetical protein BVRB_5g110120 [Beta vulgaris subsp. vulgaris]|uniref:F-box domain-containing protein n=2 Tax=Beta vulgaris subsp. vulgaris TaxID=3555 RepID=A0A0J8CGU8_BETVV|nr:hypothetical protein BVRB_5g110120 [Beta vulgaris subsp. vulgaris]
MGVQKSKTNNTNLSFKDLCCLSISCKRLRCISNEDSLWSSLLAYDFPRKRIIISSPSTKTLYKSWHEKDKARRLAAHRRAVLRKESHIAEHSERLEELRTRRDDETAKMKIAAVELSNLRKVRQASVALSVWQPEVIRGRQKQIVEQCAVPVDSRINALEMELKLCKQQVIVLEKTCRYEKQRLEEAKEQLEFMKYHPLHVPIEIVSRVDDPGINRKKLKKHITG